MAKRSRLWMLSCVMFVGLLGFPGASLGSQAELQSMMNQYVGHLQKGHSALESYNYDQAMASLTPAIKTYHEVLSVQARECECGPDEARDIRMLVQAHLMRYIMQLGQRLFDQDRFSDALSVYTQGQTLNPEYPCLRYEKGFTYFTMKEPQRAAVELYEAKRLARFPARRDVVDSQKLEPGVYCQREEVDQRSDGLLKEMGQATDYPLERDLASGKLMPGRIVPGLGVNVQWQGKSEDIYLQDSLSSVVAKLGQPDEQFEEDLTGEVMLYAQYGDTVMAFDLAHKRLQSLQLSGEGRPLLMPEGHLQIGAPARRVLDQLQQDYGFARERNKDPNAQIREALYFSHLGLVFLIGPKDEIVYVKLYSLEEDEAPAGTFSSLRPARVPG